MSLAHKLETGPGALDAELVACLEDDGPTGLPFIKHPLLVTLYAAGLEGHYNAQLGAAKLLRARYEDAGQWHSALWLHARPWRLWAFVTRYAERMSAADAGDLLSELWRDTEGPSLARETWLEMFRLYAPVSPVMRRSRLALPTRPFTVFRGMSEDEAEGGVYGLSWTLEQGKAEWFARRFERDGVVIEAVVEPEHVFAYLPERGESEVVIDTDTADL